MRNSREGLLGLSIAAAFLFAMSLLGGCASDVAYPNCRGDQACQRDGRREFCVRGHCQACRASADCSNGQSCVDNRCVDAPIAHNECSSDSNCGTGMHCVANRCVSGEGSVAISADGQGSCSFGAIHFAYDDAALDASVRQELQRAAQCLERERTTHYVLIGRADARGTTEYNLALGQRRAAAVQRYLVALGIQAERLGVSSAGSEGAEGTDEAGWAQDRRVESNQRGADTHR